MHQEVEEECRKKKSGIDITVSMQRELVKTPPSHPSRAENPKKPAEFCFFSPTLLNAGLPPANETGAGQGRLAVLATAKTQKITI